ncbi:MAG: hypothetical protein IJ258_06620 [Methanobrevibacter sp.]|uniref:hypothetical protein n=1 Tax=Methanobrevibacter sp. TaxID=66852 RepID=UPI0025FC1AFE|nr:hypothetical protein [Methanobrevibacter sp.]MBQ8017764.1 hypothetical protein [Methanobrevibacter sp.]
MIRKFLQRYYSNKSCKIDKIFTNNCKENNCKISNVSQDNVILDGDEIEKCLTKHLKNSAD